MFGIGTSELVILFVILLLLFGGSKLPQLGKSLGSFITEFKTSVKDKDKIENSPEKPENTDKTA